MSRLNASRSQRRQTRTDQNWDLAVGNIVTVILRRLPINVSQWIGHSDIGHTASGTSHDGKDGRQVERGLGDSKTVKGDCSTGEFEDKMRP